MARLMTARFRVLKCLSEFRVGAETCGALALRAQLQRQKILHREHRAKPEENLRKRFSCQGEVTTIRHPMKLVAVAMLCCLVLLGCAVVNSSALTGVWIVSDESRHGFLSAAQQKGAAKITLEANGTFAATEIPEDLLYGPPAVADGTVSGSGNWILRRGDGRQQVQLNFDAITAGQRGEVPYGAQLNVSHGLSSVTLYYFQGGDADQGRKIEFEKK